MQLDNDNKMTKRKRIKTFLNSSNNLLYPLFSTNIMVNSFLAHKYLLSSDKGMEFDTDFNTVPSPLLRYSVFTVQLRRNGTTFKVV